VGECLADVVARVVPYWYDALASDLRVRSPVLVSAHGNSLRGLVKHLLGIANDEIPKLEIPTGVPWVFDFDERLAPLGARQLGDQDDIARRAEEVARQADVPAG